MGLHGGLPWRLPADLAHFNRTTMGHSLILGRRTYESLGGVQLPGRRIIVLFRNNQFSISDTQITLTHSLVLALEMAAEWEDDEPFIGGGTEIFREALEQDLVDRMYLTIVDGVVDADTFFPEYPAADWKTVESNHRPGDEKNEFALTFQVLERNQSAR